MKRFLMIAVPVFVIGFGAGAAFWYLASPLWIDREVSEALPADFMVTEVATGQFQDADRAHKGSGTARVLQSGGGSLLVRLEDFQVTNGPDLEVWLVKEANVTASADVKNSEWIGLGQLKGNIGDQTYTVPDGTVITDYGSVVIWCEQFGVLFSPAMLTHTPAS